MEKLIKDEKRRKIGKMSLEELLALKIEMENKKNNQSQSVHYRNIINEIKSRGKGNGAK